MGASIEWGVARALTPYVLGPHEEAGDHQTPAEHTDDTTTLGLMLDAGGDGFCLTGTREEIITALTRALTAVANYEPEQEDENAAKLEAVEAVAADLAERGASIEAQGNNGSIYATRAEGRGTGYREAARLIRGAIEAARK